MRCRFCGSEVGRAGTGIPAHPRDIDQPCAPWWTRFRDVLCLAASAALAGSAFAPWAVLRLDTWTDHFSLNSLDPSVSQLTFNSATPRLGWILMATAAIALVGGLGRLDPIVCRVAGWLTIGLAATVVVRATIEWTDTGPGWGVFLALVAGVGLLAAAPRTADPSRRALVGSSLLLLAGLLIVFAIDLVWDLAQHADGWDLDFWVRADAPVVFTGPVAFCAAVAFLLLAVWVFGDSERYRGTAGTLGALLVLASGSFVVVDIAKEPHVVGVGIYLWGVATAVAAAGLIAGLAGGGSVPAHRSPVPTARRA